MCKKKKKKKKNRGKKKKKEKRIGENKKIYNHESVTFHSDGQLTWFTEFHVYNETVQ